MIISVVRSSQTSYWCSGCSEKTASWGTPAMAVGGEERLERSRGVSGVLGFLAAAQTSYRLVWAASFIPGVEVTMVDRGMAARPRSCFLCVRKTTTSSRAVSGRLLGWSDGLGLVAAAR
jgi:hypothetical protein